MGVGIRPQSLCECGQHSCGATCSPIFEDLVRVQITTDCHSGVSRSLRTCGRRFPFSSVIPFCCKSFLVPSICSQLPDCFCEFRCRFSRVSLPILLMTFVYSLPLEVGLRAHRQPDKPTLRLGTLSCLQHFFFVRLDQRFAIDPCSPSAPTLQNDGRYVHLLFTFQNKLKLK
jgi:hypothetical protein